MDSSGQLFNLEEFNVEQTFDNGPGQVVKVLPDVAGLKDEFSYLLPEQLCSEAALGSLVRIDFGGRRVSGWITEIDLDTPTNFKLNSIKKVSSAGPPHEIIELARWASLRWHGQLKNVLNTASPKKYIKKIPAPKEQNKSNKLESELYNLSLESLEISQTTLLVTSPSSEISHVILAASSKGRVLVLAPDIFSAKTLVAKIRRSGVSCQFYDRQWSGLSSQVVVGTLTAIWAPGNRWSSIIVTDENSDLYKSKQSPNWHARDVAIERCKRLAVPCLMTSSTPSLEAMESSQSVAQISRSSARSGWANIKVVDQREEEFRNLFSPYLVKKLRSAESALLILNRKGRSRMLACGSCGELVKSADGLHLMMSSKDMLINPMSGEQRPLVCLICSGTNLKNLKLGIKSAAESLSKLISKDVIDVSAENSVSTTSKFIVGTEAVLNRNFSPEIICFLDFDQELFSKRYLAAELSFSLIAKASKMLGIKSERSEIIIQTRSPEHRVIKAAIKSDPMTFVSEEKKLREAMKYPPYGVLAEISGKGSQSLIESISSSDVRIMGPKDNTYLLMAESYEQLVNSFSNFVRQKGIRVKINIDPLHV